MIETVTIYFIVLKDFIYLVFLERGDRGRKRGRKTSMCERYMVASSTPPTADLACNSGMCPDWESNFRPSSLQAGAQSTEPHQPGLKLSFILLGQYKYWVNNDFIQLYFKQVIYQIYK